jgi:hypothetical protein
LSCMGAYNAYRWYQTQTGRYTRPDPLQLDGSDPNPFLYASARPLSLIDPLGLRVVPATPPAPPAAPQTHPPVVCPRPKPTPSLRGSASPRLGAAVGAFFIGFFTPSRLGNQTLEDAFGPRNNPAKCDPCTLDPDSPDKCDDLYANDTRICGFWAARRNMRNYHACMDSAMKRFSDCRVKGIFPPRIPLAPLPFGQN